MSEKPYEVLIEHCVNCKDHVGHSELEILTQIKRLLDSLDTASENDLISKMIELGNKVKYDEYGNEIEDENNYNMPEINKIEFKLLKNKDLPSQYSYFDRIQVPVGSSFKSMIYDSRSGKLSYFPRLCSFEIIFMDHLLFSRLVTTEIWPDSEMIASRVFEMIGNSLKKIRSLRIRQEYPHSSKAKMQQISQSLIKQVKQTFSTERKPIGINLDYQQETPAIIAYPKITPELYKNSNFRQKANSDEENRKILTSHKNHYNKFIRFDSGSVKGKKIIERLDSAIQQKLTARRASLSKLPTLDQDVPGLERQSSAVFLIEKERIKKKQTEMSVDKQCRKSITLKQLEIDKVYQIQMRVNQTCNKKIQITNVLDRHASFTFEISHPYDLQILTDGDQMINVIPNASYKVLLRFNPVDEPIERKYIIFVKADNIRYQNILLVVSYE